MANLLLCPQPRQITFLEGVFALEPDRLILLDSQDPQALRFAAARLRQTLFDSLGLVWEMTASRSAPIELVTLALRVAPEKVAHPQGYELLITPETIQLNAHDEAGVFYGVCTLAQLMTQSPTLPIIELPCLHILDWPDYLARGVMLDVSRDKVPTLQTVFDLVDRLAAWKV